MDITRFSEPKFEVKSWINEMLSPQKSELQSTNSTFEVQASNLMMKLQLMVQELQNKVQEAGQRVIASVPKAVRDLESLKLEARSLKQELGQIDTQMEIFGKEYSLDIQSLKTLDAIKSRLELSINDLREANNWSVLTQDLDEILYSKDPQQIAQRISNLNRCLQLLKRESNLNVSQTEQVALVGGMQHELRQILTAPLTQALAAHNVSETTSLFILSQDADIPDLLIEVYSRYCVGELEHKWDGLETADVKTKIQRFFEFLLSFWETELNFCLNTFPSPLEVLCSVLSKSLSTICAAVATLLLALFPLEQPSNMSGAQFTELISVKSNIYLFISHFEDSILHILNSSSLQHYDLESVQSLWYTLHSPLEPYFHKYVQIGTALISEYLSRTCLLSNSEGQSLDKLSEDFKSSVQSLLSFLSQQLESCRSLSRGLLFNELIQLTDSCCEQYCNLWAERIGSCSLDQGDPSLLGYLFSLLTAVGDFALCLQHKQKEIYSEISTCLKEYINTDCTAILRLDLIPTHSPHRQSLNKLYQSVRELRDSQSISGVCYLNAISVKNLNNQTGTLLFSSLTYRIAQSLQQSTLQAVYTERGGEVQGEFDLAPSNFITEIGDYLLTLPQLIEPFISGENPGLFWSLSELEIKPPEETDVFQVFSMKRFAHDSFRHILESVLGMVCLFTQEKYLNFVIYLAHLTEHGVSQISTDIVYFKNILGALEMELLEDLASLHSLLESSPQELQLQLKESRFPNHFIRILIELSSS